MNFVDLVGEASLHAQDQAARDSANKLYAKNPMFRSLIGYVATHNPQDAVTFRNMGGKRAPANAYATMWPQQIKDSKGNVLRTNYIIDLYSIDSNGKPIGVAATKDSQTIHETAHTAEKMAGFDLETEAKSGVPKGKPGNPNGAMEFQDPKGGPSSYCSQFAQDAARTPDSKPKQPPVDIFVPGFVPTTYNTPEDKQAQQTMQNAGIK